MNEPVIYQLDNGLTVILRENHSAPVVAFQIWVGVGSADELSSEAGLAHVHEHMLFKGTPTRGVGEIAREVELAGGEINAWTSFDQTVYHIVMSSRLFDKGLGILSDAIKNSLFDESELSKELEVIQEEIKRAKDIPTNVLARELFRQAYSAHPYQNPVIGNEQSVSGFTQKDVLQFFRKWYVAPAMVLVVVGDFNEEETRKKIDTYLGDLPASADPRKPRMVEPNQQKFRGNILAEDVLESQVQIAFHIPEVIHEDIPAVDLLAMIMGQGDSSALYREIKRNRQLVNDISAYAYTPKDPGLFVLSANFQITDGAEGYKKVVEGICEAAFEFRNKRVSAEELRRAKMLIESDLIYSKQTVEGQARKLGFYQVVVGDLATEAAYHKAVAATTPEDIRRVAQKYLRADGASIVLLMPRENLELGLKVEDLKAWAKKADEKTVGIKPVQLVPGVGGIIRYEFENGLRLLILEDHSVQIASARAVYIGGQRYENEQNSGINSFVSQLLTKGTKTRSAEEISHEIESMAGTLNGFSGRNSLGMQMDILSRDFEEGLDIFADCLLNPVFSDSEVEEQRRELLAAIKSMDDNLASMAMRNFQRDLYGKHPYHLNTIGTTETISGLSREELMEFYNTHYDTPRLVLSVVGDVDPRLVVEWVDRHFGDRQISEMVTPEVPKFVPQNQPILTVKNRPKEQAHIVIGFPGSILGHRDRWILDLLSSMLSGQGGRLFAELRDRQSLAYSVTSFSLVGLDPGYFAFYIGTSPEKINVAIAGIKEQITLILEQGFDPEELERAKRFLIGSHDIQLQRYSVKSSLIAFDEAYGLGYADYLNYVDIVESITLDELQQAAETYFEWDKLVISIVAPEGYPRPEGMTISEPQIKNVNEEIND